MPKCDYHKSHLSHQPKTLGQYEEERNVRLSLTSHINIPPYHKAEKNKIISWA
jgi:hypothetical protein